MRIELQFREERRGELVPLGRSPRHIRLVAWVSFLYVDDWRHAGSFLVDSGASICAIPRDLWSGVSIQWLARKESLWLLGKRIRLTGRVGWVPMKLEDRFESEHELEVRALCADQSDFPPILGFRDILTHAQLMCDYPQRLAWLEFPSNARQPGG